MKNLYDKNKGNKIHPSPSSPTSVLALLPTAILAIASLLPLQDREVLAYMITSSIRTTNPSSFTQDNTNNNKKCKKPINSNTKSFFSNTHHKSPIFSCCCFDCYTCYWYRWDSSPNRELIHQAIEAFEDHLSSGELSKAGNAKGKKKEKVGRRGMEKSVEKRSPEVKLRLPVLPESPDEVFVGIGSSSVNEGSPVGVSGETATDEAVGEAEPTEMEVFGCSHRSLAATTAVRKSWPDVLGLFHSRLWSLWGPNI